MYLKAVGLFGGKFFTQSRRLRCLDGIKGSSCDVVIERGSRGRDTPRRGRRRAHHGRCRRCEHGALQPGIVLVGVDVSRGCLADGWTSRRIDLRRWSSALQMRSFETGERSERADCSIYQNLTFALASPGNI